LFYVFVLRRASAVIRTLIFFPVVLPTVAVALMFGKLFAIAPVDGPVNSFLKLIGYHPVDWFSSPSHAFWIIIVMDIWRSMGFYAVLLYAGLVDIPETTIEAARIDGASGLRLVRHIVIPLSFPVLLSAIIFSINGTLKVFDSILALTNGGPVWPLIITYTATGLPLTVFMLATYFRAVPREVIDAAAIDGAGIFRIFFSVAFPMVRNAILTVALVQFFFMWNDLLIALTFTNSNNLRTVQVGLLNFTGEFGSIQYGPLFAAICITVFGTLILYLALNQKVMKGLAGGAVKG
jgi:ABC-type sugar transport system permease subunit